MAEPDLCGDCEYFQRPKDKRGNDDMTSMIGKCPVMFRIIKVNRVACKDFELAHRFDKYRKKGDKKDEP